MQKLLCNVYMSCNKEFRNTVSVTFIDKAEPSNPLETKLRRKQYCRHILPTNTVGRWRLKLGKITRKHP